ncbi:MAG: penicillin-binding protein 2, partial [Rickettsiales bacterium]
MIGFSSIAIKLLSIAMTNQNNDKIVDISDKKNKRADILDRNNILIASNLNTASIYANPNIILNIDEASDKLCEVLPDLNCNQLVRDLKSKKSFTWIKRNLTPKEQQLVNNLGIPGVFFEKGEKRIYPHRELLAHILGYVGLDGRGLAGIEKYMDNELSDGRSQLNLSIDIRAQNIVHEELMDAIAEFRAIGAIGIVADASSGEIISAVSLPDYDPHSPAIANSEQLFNRFSLGLYEPGSTFKSYTMAMALDTKTIDLNDFYDVNAPIRAARFNITDYHAKGGLLSVPEIFMYSSNIGTAKISLDLGKKKQQSLLR